ncbi:hypothetical protein DBR06_SOUSAS25510014, partial [Sousa chinensis]
FSNSQVHFELVSSKGSSDWLERTSAGLILSQLHMRQDPEKNGENCLNSVPNYGTRHL